MPLYRRIECEADVRSALGQPESFELDFKRDHNPNYEELAKDIAAFANHLGGVILLGVEDNTCVLRPLDKGLCEAASQDYSNVAQSWCRPSPTVDPRVINMGNGGCVLAVNVEPLPGQPVGSGVGKRGARTSDAWRFWVRVGDKNQALSPERLPLLVDSRVRRLGIVLNEMLNDVGSRKTLLCPIPQASHDIKWYSWSFSSGSVDLWRNALEVHDLSLGENRTKRLSIPLDDVHTVWREAGDPEESWMVRVVGRILNADGKGTRYIGPHRAEALAR